MKLSIVIPAYNEARYIRDLPHAIAAVDTDATESIARSIEWVPNQGEGRAVRHADYLAMPRTLALFRFGFGGGE